jgi:hypothetical protein
MLSRKMMSFMLLIWASSIVLVSSDYQCKLFSKIKVLLCYIVKYCSLGFLEETNQDQSHHLLIPY